MSLNPLINGLVIANILCSLAQAQDLYTISVTDDGATVYVATRMRQLNTNQPLTSKVFVVDNQGLQPYGDPTAWQSAPATSGNGQVVGIAVSPAEPCKPLPPGYANCYGIPSIVTSIRGAPAGPLTVPGTVRFSQNGRYAIQVTQAATFDVPRFWDLQEGRAVFGYPLPFSSYSRLGRPVANNGTVVSNDLGLTVWRPGPVGRSNLNLGENIEDAVIDPAGSTVVYTRRSNVPGIFKSVRTVDLNSGSVRTLAEGYGDCYQPLISNDGKSVLFVSTAMFDGSKTTGAPQAFLISIEGSGQRQLTHDPAGVEFAILAGDGGTAIVLSRSGRLQSLEIVTGRITELIPRTVMLTDQLTSNQFSFACVAGSLCRLKGVGFTEDRLSSPAGPLPLSLGDVAVRLNGTAAPLLWAFPDEIAFQVPWEASGKQTVELEPRTQSVFEHFPVELSVNSRDPAFWALPAPYDRSGYGYPLSVAAHETFDSLVLPENPARPGEIVHLYATGFGSVAPAMRTGIPAPENPLSWLLTPMDCKLGDVPVTITYQGLAPGFVGLYQVSMRIPDFSGLAQIQCGNGQYLAHIPVQQPTR